MKIHSIRFKLSILYTLVLGVLFCSYSIFLYMSLQSALVEDFDNELRTKSQHVQGFLKQFYRNSVDKAISKDVAFQEAIDMTLHLDQFNEGELEDSALSMKWLQHFDQLDLSEDLIHFF
ncbi:MAG: hypothetical protein K8I00_02035, partial [Candidatus Omnitrophica bacterium]|nr:hypothetical protein [Candidatus Omnitrophota bacterium]